MSNKPTIQTTAASTEMVWVPVYSGSQKIDRLVAHPGSNPLRSAEGMQFTDSFGIYAARTEKEYKTPLAIEAMVMTDTTNIVLQYGKGEIILNWDRKEDLLHIRHPLTGQAFNFPRLGQVEAGRWHQLEWIIAEDVMRLLVNGEERASLQGNYRYLSAPVGLRTGWRANLSVGTVSITEHLQAERPHTERKERTAIMDLPNVAEDDAELEGYHWDVHQSSLLGCLQGAFHMHNRYADDVELMGATGLCFRAPFATEGFENWAHERISKDFVRLSRLLGIDITEKNTSQDSTGAYEFCRSSLKQGRPVVFRMQLDDRYRIVRACLGGSLAIEGPDGHRRMSARELDEAGELELFAISFLPEAEKRLRLVEVLGFAAQAAENAPVSLLARMRASGADDAAYAAMAAGWRRLREYAVRYLERARDYVGVGAEQQLERAIGSYRAAIDILTCCERLPADPERTATGSGYALGLLERACEFEKAASVELRALARTLAGRRQVAGLRSRCVSCMSPFNTFRGLMDHYGMKDSDIWMKGATGRPFLFAMHEKINVHDFCIPFPEKAIIERLGNLGLNIRSVEGRASGEAYRKLLDQVRSAAKDAIDAGHACFGRSVDFVSGEYSLIVGYDNDGFYSSGWHVAPERPIPWNMYGLGQCGCEPCTLRRHHWKEPGPVRTVCRCDFCQSLQPMGVYLTPQEEGEVHFYIAEPKPAVEDRMIVREALQLAVEFSEDGGRWSQPHMFTGSAAFDVLIRALEKNMYDGWYLGLHANGWKELRESGWLFLKEAKKRVGATESERAFDEAIHYAGQLHQTFSKLYEMFPWMQPFGPIPDTERRLTAIELLRSAKLTETKALHAYAQLVGLLS